MSLLLHPDDKCRCLARLTRDKTSGQLDAVGRTTGVVVCMVAQSGTAGTLVNNRGWPFRRDSVGWKGL